MAERAGGAGEDAEETPWVETAAGGLFFVNALLVAPAVVVLLPVLLRALLRWSGSVVGPSRLLDPIPTVAAHVGPYAGWLAIVPIATTVRNLVIVDRAGPRFWLVAFLAVHLTVLGWTVRFWLTR